MNRRIEIVELSLGALVSALKRAGIVPHSAVLDRAVTDSCALGGEAPTPGTKVMIRFADESFAEVPEFHAAPAHRPEMRSQFRARTAAPGSDLAYLLSWEADP